MQPPFPCCYWAEPGKLIAGQYPGDISEASARAKLRALPSCGVAYFMDLALDGELDPYAVLLAEEAAALEVKAEHHRFAIRDMSLPSRADLVATLDALDAALRDGHTVYLHCMGGIGRTGMVVGCYLVRHGLAGEAALARLAELRRGMPNAHKPAPETGAQRRLVDCWHG